MKIKQITIIGLGLLGGSLAMAIKKAKLPVNIIGTSRRPSTVRKALRLGAIDEGNIDHKMSVKGSDLIFVCTPINKIIPVIKEISSGLKRGAIVTDIGSTKAGIVKAAERILTGKAAFVGGHPMAGTERTGLDAAIPELFKGRPYILTVTKKTDGRALAAVEAFIKKLKVKVIKLSPKKQDALVAGISHLPLAVAASLVDMIASSKEKRTFSSLASSGFRDTTRVASGDPLLGADIFTTNRAAVLKTISMFQRSLKKLEGDIRSSNSKAIFAFLKRAKKFRDAVYPG